jgi:hypothetical protein
VTLRAERIDEALARVCRDARIAIERRYRIGPGGRILDAGALFGVPLYAVYYLAWAESALGEDARDAKIAFEVSPCERTVFPELGDATRVELRAPAGAAVEVWTKRDPRAHAPRGEGENATCREMTSFKDTR